MKIIWSQESLNKLDEIETYISLDSPERAIKFVDMIIEKAESLSLNPERGRIVPEYYIPEIREILQKNYRIIYRLKTDFIEIFTIFEGHRLVRAEEIFPKK